MPLPLATTEHDPATSRRCEATAWLLPLSAWRAEWPRLARALPAAQQQRLLAIRDPARRRDRMLAAALHRQFLSQALGVPAERLPLYRSAGGQPRLAVPGLHTSLAHADGVVAIALAQGGAVGVDVEMRATAPLMPIADLVCSAAELRTLARDHAPEASLLALWVRKEAVLKAAGVGLARPMSAFDAPNGACVAIRNASGDPIQVRVDTFDADEDCVAAVAAPADAHPRWIWQTP